MLLLVVIIACLGAAVAEEQVVQRRKCNFRGPCPSDGKQFCLQGSRRPVTGTCALRRALCRGARVDTKNLCKLPLTYATSCAQPRTCTRDAQRWCLKGRSSPVYGNCALLAAICDTNAEVDFTNSCGRIWKGPRRTGGKGRKKLGKKLGGLLFNKIFG